MFPLHDINPTRRPPAVTIVIIAINVVAFVAQWARGLPESVYEFGLIPAELLHHADIGFAVREGGVVAGPVLRNYDPAWVTLFTSMFMHGGLLHILGNMWFLWIFGNNVEDAMGSVKFTLFYVGAGLAAAAAQIATGPHAEVPMVGASGAIGGVLGAYLVLYPGSRVICLVTTFVITTVELPAFIVLGLWFLLQVISGASMLGMQHVGGVAYAAHVGGFVCGMALGRLLGEVHRPPPRRSAPRAPYWQ